MNIFLKYFFLTISILAIAYSNGQEKEYNYKSKGSYKKDSYNVCMTLGPVKHDYKYKVGKWKFYYPNGKLMATGIMYITETQFSNSCDGDAQIKVGKISKYWMFWDQNGNELSFDDFYFSGTLPKDLFIRLEMDYEKFKHLN